MTYRGMSCALGLVAAALVAPIGPLDVGSTPTSRQDNVPIQILASTQNIGETRPCG